MEPKHDICKWCPYYLDALLHRDTHKPPEEGLWAEVEPQSDASQIEADTSYY